MKLAMIGRSSGGEFSGVTNVPRIKELQQVAIEAQDNIEEIRQESDSNLETLINDDEDELESLF